MKKIQRVLSEKALQLKAEIRQAYDKAFEDLVTIANNHGYPLEELPDKEKLIANETNTDEVIVLTSRTNVQPFYERQLQAIMDYAGPEETPVVGEPDTHTPTETKKTEVVKLTTTSYQPIRTEEDIDAYFAQLRKQIEGYLAQHGSIMIY